MSNYMHIYINELPEHIRMSAYKVDELTDPTYAWRKDDVIEVISILQKNEYVILGGDVYEIKDQKIRMTYDSWFIGKRKEGQSFCDYINESAQHAIRYIVDYNRMNGDMYLYSVVPKAFSAEFFM